MGKKIQEEKKKQQYEVFVSGITYECTEADLQKFFEGINYLKIKLPKFQDTGRCLGYAHVTFDNEEAFAAAKAKSGEFLGKRYLTITEAKGEKPIEVKKVNVPVGCKVMFVKNLPYDISEEDIRKEFQSCGIISDIRMVRNWANEKFKGFAYIDYRDLGSVKKAIAKYNGQPMRGRQLSVDAVVTEMRKGFKKRDGNEYDNDYRTE